METHPHDLSADSVAAEAQEQRESTLHSTAESSRSSINGPWTMAAAPASSTETPRATQLRFKKTETKVQRSAAHAAVSVTIAEREAVITLVLGLVAEPPTEKYVYKPTSAARR